MVSHLGESPMVSENSAYPGEPHDTQMTHDPTLQAASPRLVQAGGVQFSKMFGPSQPLPPMGFWPAKLVSFVQSSTSLGFNLVNDQ